MTNIIGLDLADSSSDETRVFVNTDNVTHWHHEGNHTVVHFTGGTSITVTDCPWEILERIEPGPDYEADPEVVSQTNVITKGSLTPGERVEFISTLHLSDGSTLPVVMSGDYVRTGTDDQYPGDTVYHFFTNCESDGQPDYDFAQPVDAFLAAN